jgi:hypothetical protein
VDQLSGSSEVAAILSLAGVVITGLLTALTAIRSGKDRRERNADRRKIEEETTDVILKRVRAELDRAYEAIDIKDAALRKYANFFRINARRLDEMGLRVPEVDTDEGPRMREDMRRFRVELDQTAHEEAEDDGGY